MAEKKPEILVEVKPSIFSKALKVVAYPFAAIVGGYIGLDNTRNFSYDRLKEDKAFDDLLAARKAENHKLLKPSAVLKTENLPQKLTAIDNKYAKLIESRIGGMGYTNMWKRFQSMHFNQKLDVAFKATGVTGVVLGAMLAISNSKLLAQSAEASEDHKSPSR